MNNNANPKVSVLMPVYNTAKYLREAMDSMLNQTFTDFELIVLNDCSPDNADEILDTYTDSRIVRYKGEKNQGLANVLNVGMDMARGKYIARMDSDDISHPNRLKVQVDYLEKNSDVDFLSVGMQQFGVSNKIMHFDNSTEEIKFNALFFSPVLHASSMWRTERFSNLRYDQEAVPSEDYHLWTRALVCGVRMRNLPDILYRYRMHEQQATSSASGMERKAVQLNYLSLIFPNIPMPQIESLQFELTNGGKDLFRIEKALELVYKHNIDSMFFNPIELKKNIRHHLQAIAYSDMMTGRVSFDKLKYLNLRKTIKLFLSKALKSM